MARQAERVPGLREPLRLGRRSAGAWQRMHSPFFTGVCTAFAFSRPRSWQSAQSRPPAWTRSFGFALACGLWQSAQSPSLTGVCANLRPFSWPTSEWQTSQSSRGLRDEVPRHVGPGHLVARAAVAARERRVPDRADERLAGRDVRVVAARAGGGARRRGRGGPSGASPPSRRGSRRRGPRTLCARRAGSARAVAGVAGEAVAARRPASGRPPRASARAAPSAPRGRSRHRSFTSFLTNFGFLLPCGLVAGPQAPPVRNGACARGASGASPPRRGTRRRSPTGPSRAGRAARSRAARDSSSRRPSARARACLRPCPRPRHRRVARGAELVAGLTSSFLSGPACGSWHPVQRPSRTGAWTYTLPNAPACGRRGRSRASASTSSFGSFEPCGSWQAPHLPSLTGACRSFAAAQAAFCLAWQPKQRSAPALARSFAFALPCGWWQACSSRSRRARAAPSRRASSRARGSRRRARAAPSRGGAACPSRAASGTSCTRSRPRASRASLSSFSFSPWQSRQRARGGLRRGRTASPRGRRRGTSVQSLATSWTLRRRPAFVARSAGRGTCRSAVPATGYPPCAFESAPPSEWQLAQRLLASLREQVRGRARVRLVAGAAAVAGRRVHDLPLERLRRVAAPAAGAPRLLAGGARTRRRGARGTACSSPSRARRARARASASPPRRRGSRGRGSSRRPSGRARRPRRAACGSSRSPSDP